MQSTIQYRLNPCVSIEESRDGCSLQCEKAPQVRHVRVRNQSWMALCRRLQQEWVEETELLPGPDAATAWFIVIKLQRASMLEIRHLGEGNRPQFTVSPAPDESVWKTALQPELLLRLDRFAFMRREGRDLLLESPRSPCRIVVHDDSLALLLRRLSEGVAAGAIDETHSRFMQALSALRMIEPPESSSDGEDFMDFWEFHDLLFYSRTSAGRTSHPLGGTYRFHGKRPSLPVLRASSSDRKLPLPEISRELSQKLAQPFSGVLAKRRSLRSSSGPPITLEELGALLGASARIHTIVKDEEHEEELSKRPVPSGGARHPLEIYPLILNCDDASAGAYRYNPLEHQLEALSMDPICLGQLTGHAPFGGMSKSPPQVLFYISARLGRTAWKYEGIALKIVHQDLGCLYQTLYLVATALDLAPCAIGAVDSVLLAEALKVDWREEPFVGAFAIGK